ncbi:hypothetical protein L210DRAFT_3612476 [Boletus edulis BED1]|uniref:Fe2OG dioxygenase domain-containing protein n=1 Tax=Boletus edulis BED1 TaxID=1328754 RepID=A0AAD4BTR4_BOLED|nr:hypothetical protein L210DRAFT_3612476 [Boletus edulis BED1]
MYDPGLSASPILLPGDLLRRVDFSNAVADDLEALYRACKPAEFGQNGENVYDDSYRNAGMMDLLSFSTLLDPRSLGIHEQVSKALLTESHATMDAELYKLNVYGKGDFFKAHKDTPRGQDMFGSLVVVLPTAHEGGQFILRQGEKKWTLDFASEYATATEPSAFFVAFCGDIEHEVLPVTSGYRVTLTYNLYHGLVHPNTSSTLTPFHLKLKHALADLVNDKSILPNGGYLGFGLIHEYVHTGHNLVEPLLDQLKGSDCALSNVCKELGLRYSLRLLYRSITDEGFDLITTKEIDADHKIMYDCDFFDLNSSVYLREALHGLTIDEVEGIQFVRALEPFDLGILDEDDGGHEFLKPFYRTPVTTVLEVTHMKSSVNFKSSFMVHRNGAEIYHFDGTACMLIAVEPAESRQVKMDM